MKHEFSPKIFEKYSNSEFHENPPSRSRVPCGQTGMTKLFAILRTHPKLHVFEVIYKLVTAVY